VKGQYAHPVPVRINLRTTGLDCAELAFPGREEGTLGRLVYELHHAPMQYRVSGLSSASLQLLHIAAHIDAIERRIKPTLEQGRIVILDRFWWSTMVYGAVSGVSEALLRGLRELELASWGTVRPTGLFLVRRKNPLRDDPLTEWQRIAAEYDSFAAAAGATEWELLQVLGTALNPTGPAAAKV